MNVDEGSNAQDNANVGSDLGNWIRRSCSHCPPQQAEFQAEFREWRSGYTAGEEKSFTRREGLWEVERARAGWDRGPEECLRLSVVRILMQEALAQARIRLLLRALLLGLNHLVVLR
ncbi:hypothetical protein GH714_029439 [Hevea brasiliensis]|uniref:Uncharacterized protein n=1 Tax=Hevea brasiliensis TaxID=3981 RepID=A0A6A6K8J7_HEVBR|nr:hypothetical protein GH714_029439 [Hevea brasiliensis]